MVLVRSLLPNEFSRMINSPVQALVISVNLGTTNPLKQDCQGIKYDIRKGIAFAPGNDSVVYREAWKSISPLLNVEDMFRYEAVNPNQVSVGILPAA